MSRHRAVRNLDLDEELAEDDYYDEDPYGRYKQEARLPVLAERQTDIRILLTLAARQKTSRLRTTTQ